MKNLSVDFANLSNQTRSTTAPHGEMWLLVSSAGITLGPSPVALYTSSLCLQHDTGQKLGKPHPEQPARLSRLLEALYSEWVPAYGELLQIREPEADVTEEQLLRVHEQRYLDRVRGAFTNSRRPPGVRVNLDPDTVICPTSQPAIERAAGLVVAAVDDIFSQSATDGALRRAFVMVRPPGHHAESSRAGGFCVYNNVLVGVAHAQAVHGIERVAILDFDVHHGNGGENISFCDPTRLYASSHEAGNYACPGTTYRCDGLHGQILTCPLPPGGGSDDFRRVWRDQLLPAVSAFEPDALFVSAGFDAHVDDPLASLCVGEDDFEWITRELAALRGGCLPIISVLEGGYNVDALVKSVHAHVHGLIHS